jgi:arylsulfatase
MARLTPRPGGIRAEKRRRIVVAACCGDIGWFNVSAYNMGIMGYRTSNIDRIGQPPASFSVEAAGGAEQGQRRAG